MPFIIFFFGLDVALRVLFMKKSLRFISYVLFSFVCLVLCFPMLATIMGRGLGKFMSVVGLYSKAKLNK